MRKKAVIALGGNALIKEGQEGTIFEQFENTRNISKSIVKLGIDTLLEKIHFPKRNEYTQTKKIIPYILKTTVLYILVISCI